MTINQPVKTSLIHFTVVLCLGSGFHSLQAQIFEKVPGRITSTPSDSRSVNFLDLNKDGWEDIYISNGLKGGQRDLLYLNNGDGTFSQVEDQEIVQASNPSDGASFADFNNDGHIDGVISSWYGAEDLLYLNNGNGQLNYLEEAGIAPGSYAETAAFGDYDQDGWLDLYITNSGGSKTNYLYRNLRNGKFERISDHPLVRDLRLSRAAIWTDVNNDGQIDLFVANEDNAPNDLYLGLGKGAFERFSRGSIVVGEMSSMTASWGDIDNDGDPDLFVGNSGFYSGQRNQLYRNFGDNFAEISDDPVSSYEGCTFGSAFGDYDNDGDLDLVIANGFCNGNMQNKLYENQGDGHFTDVSDLLPINLNICSFGIAWGDIDNDGFLDLLAANCRNKEEETEKSNSLFRNLGNDNHWLKVRLEGTQSNAIALGAKVRIKASIGEKSVWQVREVSAQSGYAGQNSLILHFGLKDAERVDSLIVEWPAGNRTVLEDVKVNEQLNLVEQTGLNSLPGFLLTGVDMQISPNPVSGTSDSLQIVFRQDTPNLNGALRILDSRGSQVWQSPVRLVTGTSNQRISLAELKLSPGIYIISLIADEKVLSRKVIIQ